MQKELINEISTKILEGDFVLGDRFFIDYRNGELYLGKVEAPRTVNEVAA